MARHLRPINTERELAARAAVAEVQKLIDSGTTVMRAINAAKWEGSRKTLMRYYYNWRSLGGGGRWPSPLQQEGRLCSSPPDGESNL